MTKLTALLFAILLFGCTIEQNKQREINHLGGIADDSAVVAKIPLIVSKNKAGKGLKEAMALSVATLPSTFILATPPVENQMDEGACSAFATNIVRSVNWYYKTGATTYDTMTDIFSPEFLYNQCKVNSDCYSGSAITACLNFIYNYGVCTWALMPQVNRDCATQPTSYQTANAANYKIANYSKFLSTDTAAIKQCLYSHYAIALPIAIDNAFLNCTSGFIWSPNTISAGSAPHSVALIGWDDSKHAFKIQNSFGTTWGDNGFGWIDYDLFFNELKVGYYCYGALVEVGTPPPPAEMYNISVTKKTVKGKVNDIINWYISLNNTPQSAQLQVAADTVNFATVYAITPYYPTGTYTYIPTIKTTRYYRLKIIRSDLSIVYSSIGSIL